MGAPHSIPGVWSDGRQYEALVPAHIADLPPVGGFEEAEAALVSLDAVVRAHARSRQLAGSVLYAESLPNAQVRRLALGRKPKLGAAPHQAMAAFRKAVAVGVERGLDETTLAQLHRVVLPGGGRLRQRLVWVGGLTPAEALFTAPPADLVPDLLADLMAYLRRADVSPLEQAAIGYAQFEFIHPFVDGNGRVGRVLLQLIPRRRGLVDALVAPLGLLFFANLPDFITAHTGYRDGDYPAWCRYVAELTVASANNLVGLLDAGRLS